MPTTLLVRGFVYEVLSPTITPCGVSTQPRSSSSSVSEEPLFFACFLGDAREAAARHYRSHKSPSAAQPATNASLRVCPRGEGEAVRTMGMRLSFEKES